MPKNPTAKLTKEEREKFIRRLNDASQCIDLDALPDSEWANDCTDLPSPGELAGEARDLLAMSAPDFAQAVQTAHGERLRRFVCDRTPGAERTINELARLQQATRGRSGRSSQKSRRTPGPYRRAFQSMRDRAPKKTWPECWSAIVAHPINGEFARDLKVYGVRVLGLTPDGKALRFKEGNKPERTLNAATLGRHFSNAKPEK